MSPMRIPLALLCLTVLLRAQEATPALNLLEGTARKFQTIGSYEYSAIAERPLGGGFIGKVHLTRGYASANFTPPDLPVPILDAGRMGLIGIFDREGKPAPPDYLAFRSLAGPGPSVPFSEISWRAISAKITGAETLKSHACQIVIVWYEDRRSHPNGGPVRYWIDPQTNLIWKMQYSAVDPLSKTAALARWTVSWESWTENQPPPAWLIEIGKKEGAQERTALLGRPAPEIVGFSLAGGPFQLSRLRGSVVVLDFWGTSCGPCSEQMASLEKLKASLSGKPVEIWSVTEDRADAAKRWIAERGHTLPTATVAKGSAFKAYGIDVLPQLVIVGPQGNVVHQWAGVKKESDILDIISELTGR
jgi:peroxiredoxin